jgi:CO/xanthine dehydrogenase FAD-binding subunit
LRPRPFEYYAPSSIGEVLNLLNSEQEAKILAGGQSLVTLMKLHLASPKTLIDINGIPELSEIREERGTITIGALTRHDQIAKSHIIREKCLLVAEAAGQIADQQVRNRGTIGGSLAHADPTADLPTACTAVGATVVAISVEGSREIKSDDFFRDYFTTSLRQDEVLREVRIPVSPPRTGGAYVKLTKGHNDFAVVSVAAQISLDGNRVCTDASVVLGGVAPTPRHAVETERYLAGRKLGEEAIKEGSQRAAEGLRPPSDIRASSEYRVEMSRVLAERALKECMNRASGGV